MGRPGPDGLSPRRKATVCPGGPSSLPTVTIQPESPLCLYCWLYNDEVDCVSKSSPGPSLSTTQVDKQNSYVTSILTTV